METLNAAEIMPTLTQLNSLYTKFDQPVCFPLSRNGVYIKKHGISNINPYWKNERALLTEEAGKGYKLSGELTVVNSQNAVKYKQPEVSLQADGVVIARHALNVDELYTQGRRLPLSLTFPASAINGFSEQRVNLTVHDSGSTVYSKITEFELYRGSVNEYTILTLHTAGNGAQSMVWGFNA
ncbi:hypothetical protein, partial [Enterobacter bugandensis]|uniref:hypothetical protein n=1 Tax=Enterobacter bugandensis TaxID=881260 RepID=UPI0021D33548